ncbi:MAG: sugar transferase, partial [Acidimicrobiales bacterium]
GLSISEGEKVPSGSKPPAGATGWRALSSPLTVLVVDLGAILLGTVQTTGFGNVTLGYSAGLLAWLAILGLYRTRVVWSIQGDLRSIVSGLACPLIVLAAIESPTTLHLLRMAPVVILLVVLGRSLSYAVVRFARTHSTSVEPTLIVGAGTLGCKIATVLLEHPEYGLAPVGFVDGFPDDGTLPLPLVGDINTLDHAVRRTGAVRIIVAFGANREADIAEVLRSADVRLRIHIIPRLFELGVAPSCPDSDMVWGFPLQLARRAALRTPAWLTKRIVDVCVSAPLLVLSLPILVIASLAVRLTSKGPILFRQQRVGQRGDVIEILKFRSMRLNSASATEWGGSSDSRITAVGRWLRATDIDELPQLVNVLRGDMSLVGPRPERPHFSTQFNQCIYRYNDRLRVPVGLTGWAQVHGLRGDTSIEDRVRFDNYYIEHWSAWFDVVILARTAGHVARTIFSAGRWPGHAAS